MENGTAEEMLSAARAASVLWRDTPLSKRTGFLRAFRGRVVDELDLITETLKVDAGKPSVETILNDVLPTLEIATYLERRAGEILRSERRRSTFFYPRSRFTLEYHPRGVVLVLAPWNFPFQLALVPTLSALVAGNGVLLKVSERMPGMGPLLQNLFNKAGFPKNVVQVVTGGPDMGEALVQAGPDMVFLTGSQATGRRVMKMAADRLIPLVLELGGKDPMIVFPDAPFDRAVEAAVYGAFVNAGQVCVSVERVFAHRSLFDRFAAALVRRTAALRLGSDVESDVGPLINEGHADRFRHLVQDALDKGARALTPVTIQGRRAAPVILTGVDSRMRLWEEEAFGPVLLLAPFQSEDEVVGLANGTSYGLNASVWTMDLAKGRRVASRLECGNVAVNDVMKNIGNPHMPFGGVKASGLGLSHGPEGLRSFCRPLSLMVNTGRWPREPNWFPYGRKLLRDLKMMFALIFSTKSWGRRLVDVVKLGRAYRQELRRTKNEK
ncbi:MAG: aldehyde dehydrogenase family protein [Elusimicrobia bacterium]|nr:aldehyde dehydrogenase family protein [Elusimicrobiota bacterium]